MIDFSANPVFPCCSSSGANGDENGGVGGGGDGNGGNEDGSDSDDDDQKKGYGDRILSEEDEIYAVGGAAAVNAHKAKKAREQAVKDAIRAKGKAAMAAAAKSRFHLVVLKAAMAGKPGSDAAAVQQDEKMGAWLRTVPVIGIVNGCVCKESTN